MFKKGIRISIQCCPWSVLSRHQFKDPLELEKVLMLEKKTNPPPTTIVFILRLMYTLDGEKNFNLPPLKKEACG